jgi:hypothetical protein
VRAQRNRSRIASHPAWRASAWPTKPRWNAKIAGTIQPRMPPCREAAPSPHIAVTGAPCQIITGTNSAKLAKLFIARRIGSHGLNRMVDGRSRFRRRRNFLAHTTLSLKRLRKLLLSFFRVRQVKPRDNSSQAQRNLVILSAEGERWLICRP